MSALLSHLLAQLPVGLDMLFALEAVGDHFQCEMLCSHLHSKQHSLHARQRHSSAKQILS